VEKKETIMSKILIIEDDDILQQGLAEILQFHGFETISARDGILGLKLVGRQHPDLIVLDIMLPGLDGYEICKQVRRHDEKTPILMLTARDRENDKLLGFELGADDYLTKPFSLKELVARVQALLKRTALEKDAPVTVRIGDIEVLFRRFEIRRGKKTLELTPKENAILRLLVAHSPEVVSRDRIMDRVWSDEYDPSPRTIDNFILKLRQKIERDPARPEHLLTVHGAGYKLIM
jgi:DNA-binding response OmpR family regulator